MNRSRKFTIPLVALGCAFLFGGCYTKIASFQSETMPTGSAANTRCGDCQEEVAVSNRREVCVWERDILGFPEMRCYTTNYASSWVYFHNTPWWYRDRYTWHNNRGCPPYYNYDRFSGTCRYYGGGYVAPPPSGGTGGGSGGGMTPGTVEPRRGLRNETSRTSSVPATPPPTSSEPMFTGSTKQLSPTGAPTSTSSTPSTTTSTTTSTGQSGAAKPQEPPASGGQTQQQQEPPPPPPPTPPPPPAREQRQREMPNSDSRRGTRGI